MYKNILVPLDGSQLAECVLPHVESIVRGCQAPTVNFVRVTEPLHLPIGPESDGAGVYSREEAGQVRKTAESIDKVDAESYLSHIAAQNKYPDTKVQTAILAGKPAETIVDYADKNNIDLIVIATHGRSGVSRWVWGSTSDKILRSSCVPVLMVRAPGCIPGI